MAYFVSDERVVIYELPAAAAQELHLPAIGALTEDAYRSFRSDLPLALQDELNAIWIPGRMGLHRRKLLQDTLTRITQQVSPLANSHGAPASATEVQLHVGAYQVALLEHNILRWEGPGFRGMPLTQANIHRLDPDAGLLAAVLDEIGRRNPLGGRASPDPKSPTTTTTATSAGGSASTGS